jgi:hypothetical protein
MVRFSLAANSLLHKSPIEVVYFSVTKSALYTNEACKTWTHGLHTFGGKYKEKSL